jgi:hypothetical protein
MSKTQDAIERLKRWGHIEDLDPKAINRFTEAALSYKDIDQDDAIQAAAFIVALEAGTFGGDRMAKQIRDIMGIPRRPRTPKFKPEYVMRGEPAWEIVERIYIKKEITHGEGVELFEQNITPNVKRRTIEGYIAVIRLDVENKIDHMKGFIELE